MILRGAPAFYGGGDTLLARRCPGGGWRLSRASASGLLLSRACPPSPVKRRGVISARPSSAWRSLRALQTPAPSGRASNPFGIPALGGGRVRLAKFAV